MNIIITGGGTGGHLIIAKTFGEELKNRGINVIFVGSTHGQDRAWFENSEIFSEKYFLQSSGVVNKKGLGKILSLLNIAKLALDAKKIIAKHQAKAVISVGGYSAAAAAFGAILSHTPLFIHEQNAVIGRLNQLLKSRSAGFYSSYFEPKFDYPVNPVFFKTARVRQELETIIFLGGSQGAKFINDLALALAPKLNQKGIKIIHQCGQKDFDRVNLAYKDLGIDAEVLGFCSDLQNKMAKADLCVGRSGASTLWELCANALPSIFVPFPHAAADHQYTNAKFLADMGLAKVIRQNEISNDEFLGEIMDFNIHRASMGLQNTIAYNTHSPIIDDILAKLGKI